MPDSLRSLLSFLIVLPVIIVVHEAGHLLMAKLFKMRVLAFSVGFGKALWSMRRGETEYRLSLIPLGGYVKLSGEIPDEATEDPGDFLNRPRWQRILVYLAGPFANVVLAVAVVAIVFMVGIEITNLGGDAKPIIGAIEAGSSAAQAGLQRGDLIVAAKGRKVDNWEDVAFSLIGSPEQIIPLQVKRGARTLAVQVTPKKIPGQEAGDLGGMIPSIRPQIISLDPGQPAEAAGFKPGDEIRRLNGRPIVDSKAFIDEISQQSGRNVAIEVIRDGRLVTLQVVPKPDPALDGRVRIGVKIGFYQRYSPGQAVIESVKFNAQTVRQTFQVLGKLLTRELSPKTALAGPLEIAKQSGEAAKQGFKYLLHFMAFLSLSIAIMNLLPIPILDGGNIFILLIESGIRRNLSLRLREVINQVGFVMILLLMGMVLWLDFGKQFIR
jgi:regulator of sigma E protease